MKSPLKDRSTFFVSTEVNQINQPQVSCPSKISGGIVGLKSYGNPLVGNPISELLLRHKVLPKLHQQFLMIVVKFVVFDLSFLLQNFDRVPVALVLVKSFSQIKFILLVCYVLDKTKLGQVLFIKPMLQRMVLQKLLKHFRMHQTVL